MRQSWCGDAYGRIFKSIRFAQGLPPVNSASLKLDGRFHICNAKLEFLKIYFLKQTMKWTTISQLCTIFCMKARKRMLMANFSRFLAYVAAALEGLTAMPTRQLRVLQSLRNRNMRFESSLQICKQRMKDGVI